MKAICKPAAAPGVALCDAPIPTCGDNDVLIKIRKTSICGTDSHIDVWDKWAQKTIKAPMIIGHEFVGIATEIGRNVRGVKVGDRVVGEGHITCGTCRNCIEGRRHLCPNTQGVGVNRQGAFAEYLSIPGENVWVVNDPALPDDVLSCFDPLGNAVHTALSFDLVGEDVLITGAGPIGCMAAAIARHVGARNIVITDVNPARLELARRMGRNIVPVNVAQEKLTDAMARIGMKEGFDIGLEMSGSPQAFQQMIDAMLCGGRIAMLGIVPDGAGIDWTKVIFKGLFIKGIYGREIFATWYKMQAMIQSGLDISPVITHRMHYTEFEKGFELMRTGKCGKVVLSWE